MKSSQRIMDTNIIAEQLLEDVKLSPSDSARLALETIELLGKMAQRLTRSALISLLRQTIREGVVAVQAATRTVSLGRAAWASVEARKNLRPASRRDLRHFVRRILRVEGVANLPLRAMTTARCKSILQAAFGASPSSYVKGRAIMHGIFTLAYGRNGAMQIPCKDRSA